MNMSRSDLKLKMTPHIVKKVYKKANIDDQ